MARFDVYRAKDRSGAYMLDCQADSLSHLTTRFVVPLLPQGAVPPALKRLHPELVVDDQLFVMATHLAAAVATKELGERIDDLGKHAETIIGALDMLITGV